MAGKYKTQVQAKDIEVLSDSKVAIRSTGLLNTFVQSPAHAIAKLTKDVAPVHPDEIEVDDTGRIIINDAAFVTAIQHRMAALAASKNGSNTVCNNAYKCSQS